MKWLDFDVRVKVRGKPRQNFHIHLHNVQVVHKSHGIVGKRVKETLIADSYKMK